MKDVFSLQMDGRPVEVNVKGSTIRVEGEVHRPNKATMDLRRKIPFWWVLTVVLLVAISGFLASVMLSGLFESVIEPTLVLFVGLGMTLTLSVFTYLMINQPREVLVIGYKGGSFILDGDEEDLHLLHYILAKKLIPKGLRKEPADGEDRDRRTGREAGVSIGEKLLDRDDAVSIRSSLRRDKRKRMITQICPHCGGTELYYEGGLISGYVYHCKDCDYVGSFIIEKELRFSDEEDGGKVEDEPPSESRSSEDQ